MVLFFQSCFICFYHISKICILVFNTTGFVFVRCFCWPVSTLPLPVRQRQLSASAGRGTWGSRSFFQLAAWWTIFFFNFILTYFLTKQIRFFQFDPIFWSLKLSFRPFPCLFFFFFNFTGMDRMKGRCAVLRPLGTDQELSPLRADSPWELWESQVFGARRGWVWSFWLQEVWCLVRRQIVVQKSKHFW